MYLLFQFLVLTVIVLFTAWIIPGITISSIPMAMVTAGVIALINTVLKPLLNLITLPVNVVTLGLFALIINALLLMFVAYLVPGFTVSGFWSAFFGALVISLLTLGMSYIEF